MITQHHRRVTHFAATVTSSTSCTKIHMPITGTALSTAPALHPTTYKQPPSAMDDSLLVDYDPSYRSRRSSVSDSEDGRSGNTSSSSSLREIGKNLAAGATHRVRKHRSHSTDSMDDNRGSNSGSGSSSGLQERIFSKLMQQMLPSDYTLESYSEPRDRRRDKDRPQFSLTTMSSNFRRFNAR